MTCTANNGHVETNIMVSAGGADEILKLPGREQVVLFQNSFGSRSSGGTFPLSFGAYFRPRPDQRLTIATA